VRRLARLVAVLALALFADAVEARTAEKPLIAVLNPGPAGHDATRADKVIE
jgi:hypothetical protein